MIIICISFHDKTQPKEFHKSDYKQNNPTIQLYDSSRRYQTMCVIGGGSGMLADVISIGK